MNSNTAPSRSVNATMKPGDGLKGARMTFSPRSASAISGTRNATCGKSRSGPVTGLSGSKRRNSTL